MQLFEGSSLTLLAELVAERWWMFTICISSQHVFCIVFLGVTLCFLWCQTLETWCFFSFLVYLYFTISRHELSRISHGTSLVPIAACSHVWKYWFLFVTEEFLESQVLQCFIRSLHSRNILIVLYVFSWKVFWWLFVLFWVGLFCLLVFF